MSYTIRAALTRRITVHALPALAAAVLAAALIAAPAQASLGIGSFSITPSVTQAGASPALTVEASFSSRNGDTPKDATISLAPGLLANPTAVTPCPVDDFNDSRCPDASRIGTGTVTGTAPEFAFTLSLPADAYLIQPQGSEPARIGLIVTFFDYPVASQSAPVTIRTAPTVGLDIPLTGLPNELDGVPVKIDALRLTISSSVGGTPFTRNPTSCEPATSMLTVDSYGAPTTNLVAQSAFTPTGCDTLGYGPTIAGTVTEDAAGSGIAIDTTISQRPGDADTKSVTVTLPAGASPRLSSLGQACGNTDLTSCPAVGSATVATPLLTQPLTAKIVLVAHAGSLPTLAILIPPPFGLTLTATPVLSGSTVQAVVSDIPDFPITSLTLSLPGGTNSLFVAGANLCTKPQTLTGSFTAWSGASASSTASVSVADCPSSTGSTGSNTGTQPQSGTGSSNSVSGAHKQRHRRKRHHKRKRRHRRHKHG